MERRTLERMEFLVQSGTQVVPVEVKAGINTKAKSLGEYIRCFSPALALRTSLCPLKKGDPIVDVPLYAFGAWLAKHLNSRPRFG